MVEELCRKSAFELAALIRAREVKPSELMKATLARIESVNPKVNAFCALRADEAMAEAGALVVGKTNTPEFGATGFTRNLLFGVTRNPWNLERTPGGSSGGSGAAIAGGVIPLVTASDGGGSIRLPAAMTGCFGLKISFGRIPHGPEELWVMGDTAVVGPLTRTVEDAALHLDLVAGPHPLDPNSLPPPRLSH